MKLTYDSEADAAYIYVNKGKIQKTLEKGEGILVDIGQRGKLIGIEILSFSHRLKIQSKLLSKVATA